MGCWVCYVSGDEIHPVVQSPPPEHPVSVVVALLAMAGYHVALHFGVQMLALWDS